MTEPLQTKASQAKKNAVALYTLGILGLGMMVGGLYEMTPDGTESVTPSTPMKETATGIYDTTAVSLTQSSPAVPIFGDIATGLLFLGGFVLVMGVVYVGRNQN